MQSIAPGDGTPQRPVTRQNHLQTWQSVFEQARCLGGDILPLLMREGAHVPDGEIVVASFQARRAWARCSASGKLRWNFDAGGDHLDSLRGNARAQQRAPHRSATPRSPRRTCVYTSAGEPADACGANATCRVTMRLTSRSRRCHERHILRASRVGVQKVGFLHARPQVLERQRRGLESRCCARRSSSLPAGLAISLRVAALAQPPRQCEQSLLSSPEVRPGVDVDDGKRASIFSFLPLPAGRGSDALFM